MSLVHTSRPKEKTKMGPQRRRHLPSVISPTTAPLPPALAKTACLAVIFFPLPLPFPFSAVWSFSFSLPLPPPTLTFPADIDSVGGTEDVREEDEEREEWDADGSESSDSISMSSRIQNARGSIREGGAKIGSRDAPRETLGLRLLRLSEGVEAGMRILIFRRGSATGGGAGELSES